MKTNTNIQKLEDKSFIIKSTIDKKAIDSNHQKVLLEIQKNFKTKGFRPGKAPLNLIEQESDPKAVLEEVISRTISEDYSNKIKENNLQPICDPMVKILTKSVDYGMDWEVEYNACEMPEVEITPKAYEEIKKMKDKNVDKIIEILLENSKIEIPKMLAQKEKEWKVNLIIDKIAQNEKIQVSSDEIRAVLASNPSLGKDINLVFYLIRQQKVFSHLQSLK
jgi:FKBP-type peptidyl-prolyl cis-trans isomerase (trigger factor)